MKNELWFSYTAKGMGYDRGEAAFFSYEPFVWANDFSNNVDAIRSELREYTYQFELKNYFNKRLASKEKSWKTIALKVWGIHKVKEQKYFPLTSSLFKKYPEIVSVSFSLLEPESAILPHNGDTNGIYRCHLGISIPAELPACGFEVKEEQRAWKKSEWLIFLDAHRHRAWNHSNLPRFIMIVDVIRPEFIRKKTFITSSVLTALFMQKFLGKARNKYTSFGMYLCHKIIRPFVAILAWFCNAFKLL